MINRSVFAA